MAEARITLTTQPEARTHRAPTDVEIDFCAAVVRALLQPLTVASGRVQRAKKFIESDPARAESELDDACEQLDRIDRLLAELRVRPPAGS